MTAMQSISVNKFRDNLKSVVPIAIENHVRVKVTRRAGEDFIVIGADDWEREQETLYVLQNRSLMQQISQSLASSMAHTATSEEVDVLLGV